MRRTTSSGRDLSEEIIRQLKDELYIAQHAVIELMTPGARKVLESYRQCVTVEDTDLWLYDVTDDLIDMAEVLPPTPFYLGERGNCPLCGCGPDSPYDKGFALPEGLRMHLLGKGNARQCCVMRASSGLARSYWDNEFHPRWSPEHEAARAKLKLRRVKETQYLVSPYVAPRLLDEGFYPGHVRSAEELAHAEARLSDLGFQLSTKKKIRAYVKDLPNAVAYADPRGKRAISVAVLLKPVEEGLRRWEVRRVPVGSFRIPDAWKNDLAGKLEAALAETVKGLIPPLKLVS